MARVFNGSVLTGFVAGLIGGMLAPMLLPNGPRSARPLAKSAIKAGLAAYEAGRERFAELGETASDLVAEVQADRTQEQATRQSPPAQGTPEAALATLAGDELEAARSRRYDA